MISIRSKIRSGSPVLIGWFVIFRLILLRFCEKYVISLWKIFTDRENIVMVFLLSRIVVLA